MVQQQSIVYICDNSGAKIARCIKILKKKKVAKIGDLLLVSVIKKNKFSTLILSNTNLYLAILIRNSKIYLKQTGIVKYGKKAEICLLNTQQKLLATRIYGSIPKELKRKKLFKLLSIAIPGFY